MQIKPFHIRLLINIFEAWFASTLEELQLIDDQVQAMSAGAGNLENDDNEVAELWAYLLDNQETINQLQLEKERFKDQSGGASEDGDISALIQHDAAQAAVDVTKDNSDQVNEHFDCALPVLASSVGCPLGADEIALLLDGVRGSTVNVVLRILFNSGVVQREKDRQSYKHELD